MRNLSHRDVMYDGGHRNSRKKKEKKSSSSIWNCFQSKSSDSQEESFELTWQNMNPVQKKERIQKLWAKARKYTGKLRF